MFCSPCRMPDFMQKPCCSCHFIHFFRSSTNETNAIIWALPILVKALLKYFLLVFWLFFCAYLDCVFGTLLKIEKSLHFLYFSNRNVWCIRFQVNPKWLKKMKERIQQLTTELLLLWAEAAIPLLSMS